ncbi:rhodanese-like domain-containing protein [Variovorax sp. J22P271]|uniref:rhodanese-like domain-containing protein n=1 Tax=Variovorax davisae TaxID=3053515 RepID=UPI002575684D|nr:rhodanese-like domain-containing protein [Variovorax sp. J22P271]MDM0030707.1 rhodanese-like domain-containing protein [Variovorax sp. J22P271]
MIDQIRPTELADWFARNPNARPVVLDVREPWELQTASVAPQGFTLATIPMNEIPARVSELDPGQRIACLCHHGARSQRVAAFLAQNGFGEVANIAGGIDAWSAQHDPSVPRY